MYIHTFISVVYVYQIQVFTQRPRNERMNYVFVQIENLGKQVINIYIYIHT